MGGYSSSSHSNNKGEVKGARESRGHNLTTPLDIQ